MRAERSYGRVHEHATQDGRNTRQVDIMHFDGREVARARPRDACALGRAVCCEHILSAKGSSVQGGVWAGPE